MKESLENVTLNTCIRKEFRISKRQWTDEERWQRKYNTQRTYEEKELRKCNVRHMKKER